VFFAISGFVVTLSLKDKLSSLTNDTFLERLLSARQLLAAFYKKRFFRIFPVVLFVTILVGIFLGISEKDSSWIRSLLRAPFEILCGAYSYSVETFVTQEKIHIGGIGPFWTLAIEAQFYIFWPIILLLCKDNNSRAKVSLLLGCLFLFIVYPVSLLLIGKKYYLVHNNMAELFLGSFLAFLYNGNIVYKFRRNISMIMAILCALGIWCYNSTVGDAYFTRIVPEILSIAVVALAVFAEGSFNIPGLNKVFGFLGRRSYSFYAIQLSIAQIIVWYTNSVYFPKEFLSEHEFYLYQFVIFIVVLLVVTELVYKMIEKPGRKLGYE
jgi:peptidoglycan/LPS O-acetylase OafA/YrhL